MIIRKTAADGLIDMSGCAYRPKLYFYGKTLQNLWNNPTKPITQQGVTITPNGNGSITFSGTAAATTYFRMPIAFQLKTGTQYTVSVDKPLETGVRVDITGFIDSSPAASFNVFSGASTGTGSIANSCEYIYQQICVTSGTSPTGTYRFMMNEGDTAEDFIHPGFTTVSSISAELYGDNLLRTLSVNCDKLADGWIHYDSLEANMYLSILTGVMDYLSPSEGYYLMFEVRNASGLENVTLSPSADYTSGNNYSQFTNMGTGHFKEGVNLYELTTKASSAMGNVNYGLRAQIVNSNREYASFDFRISLYKNKPKGYAPQLYKNQVIDLQGHYLRGLPDNGIRDELRIEEDGSVKLVQRCGKIVLDGEDKAMTNIYVGDDYDWFDCYIKPGDAYHQSKDDYTDVLCDRFYAQTSSGANVKPGIWVNSNGHIAIRMYKDKIVSASLSSVNGWLKNNNATVIYRLDEEKVIDLGRIDLPVNTQGILASANIPIDIEARYYRREVCGDGIAVSGKHSYYSDLRQCIATRDTGKPEKKLSTKTVPYMSGFYDFSKVYGAIAYESRELVYSFDVIGSREEVQAQKSALMNWLADAHDCDIYDDDIPGWHFHGSLSSMDWSEDDSGESGTLEVTFLCHPFLIADSETTESLAAGSRTVTIEGQPVNPTAKTSSGAATITIGGIQQSISTTPTRLTAQLMPGSNSLTISGGTVQLTYREQKL